jgi:hypothetical protein
LKNLIGEEVADDSAIAFAIDKELGLIAVSGANGVYLFDY